MTQKGLKMKTINEYKFLGRTGKRGGIAHYQVVDDDEMDKIIADKAGSCGYGILDYSYEDNRGQIQIWSSNEALIAECENLLSMYKNDELPYCEDEEEKAEVTEKINHYLQVIDEIKDGKFFKF